MVNYQGAAALPAAAARGERSLDAVFAALADPTRRRVLAQLREGAQPVTALAQPFAMSLPGFMKHLGILEGAGLMAREKQGRVVRCNLVAEPMKNAADWLVRYRQFWDERLEALARFLEETKEDPWKPRQRKNPRSRSSATLQPRRKRSSGHGPTRKR